MNLKKMSSVPSIVDLTVHASRIEIEGPTHGHALGQDVIDPAK